MSADGSVVVGDAADQAVLWRAGVGITPLGALGEPAGSVVGVAGVSADGTVVAGTFLNGATPDVCPSPFRPFRWTSGTGLIDLGIPTVERCFVTEGISADGRTVFMWGHRNEDNAYGWTALGGIELLGPLLLYPGGIPYAASYDGSVVVGSAAESTFVSSAVRWVGGAMLPLGTEGVARAISWDGTTIFGDGPDGVFRWTDGGGAVPLGFFGTPVGVTSDGALLATSDSLWDAIGGPRSVLAEFTGIHGLGAALAGWTLGSIAGISADGRAIIGNGIDPAGESSGWIAIIPEPSSLPLLCVALAGVAALARARGRLE